MRMGVNLGDVIVEGEDRHGEVVNIAARLQTLADPGGITVSRTVAEHVGHKLDVKFEDLGERHVKNIGEPVHIYKVRPSWLSERPAEALGKLPTLPGLMTLLMEDDQRGDAEQEWLEKIARSGILTRLSGVTWVLAIGLPQRQPTDDNLTFGGA